MGKTSGLFAAAATARPADPRRLLETLRRELFERWPQTVERFRCELESVGGRFHRVATIADVPAAVLTIAREGQARRLVIWHPTAFGADLGTDLRGRDLEVESMPAGAPASPEEGARLRERIAGADIGVTGVDLAIAETGTLVLVSDAGRPRSTALLPPTHVAVFDRTALVESLAQTGLVLEAWHQDEPAVGWGAAIHFITGPSRTADIELTLTRGVHGPRDVHAIFVDAPFRD